ncbi:NGFI-A-binding protein 1-like isoform X3 [Limulus polyphemus]|uniref:NGFI-A-binding protein 1-like isoform X3 n=1 Tax=Limulus polyphemus TaxID=6850 RepID=A0ABM1S5Q5_LIMPO|nr:NGFI-A-binding protein 1-like isoform X3 [Limulus polyphemus]
MPLCSSPSMEQVRDYLNHCPVPVTSDATPTSVPGPGSGSGSSGPPLSALGPAGCMGSRILSRNVNGTIAMTSQPSNESELQLYRVLQRANLLSYYDTFICQGGDDVQQLCEAGEEEFLEIMALVGMASKPLHVRRLQKALQEWVNNPAMFQAPLIPSFLPNPSNHPLNMPSVSRPGPGPGGGGNSGVNALLQPTGLPLRPSPPVPMLPSSSQSSPSPGRKDTTSPCQLQQQQQQHPKHQSQQHFNQTFFQQGGGDYGQPGSPINLTPVLVESQIQRLAEAAEWLVKTLPPFEPKPQNNKKKISKDLEYVMTMAEDDPRRMDEIRKYAAIYGRFDCKRKPEKPLTLHEVSVNEAAAQICKHIPTLLTRRDELFPLARQVVRDSGYQYSKGHSSLDDTYRSQSYNRSFDEENCKHPRLDPSPNSITDKAQLEEERKKRQDRLEFIAEQLKTLGHQQEEMKIRLQQAREIQDYTGANQIQPQLEQISTQQMQLINEQSELNKQLRKIERQYSFGRGYSQMSTCSEPEKVDTDDTDSQFSVYSTLSSPALSQDNQNSPSQDSSHSLQTQDVFTAMRAASANKRTNAQITKQLVQETLMDEGLRVIKELANQIKDESEVHVISPPKPEGRPRGRPPKLSRDYVSTASSTGVSSGAHNRMISPSSNSCVTTLSRSVSGTSPQIIHNGYSTPLNGSVETDNYHHRNSTISTVQNATNGMGDLDDKPGQNGTYDGSKPVENSLNALVALSQMGIKQEPTSPSTTLKMD